MSVSPNSRSASILRHMIAVFLLSAGCTAFAISVAPTTRFPSRFVVYEGEGCGYINGSGSLEVAAKFHECEDFAEGLAPVEIAGKWGFIDTDGSIRIRPQFDEARFSFSEGLAAVRLGKYWGYVDTAGEFVIPPKFDFGSDFKDGRAVVLEGQQHGVIDRTGVLQTDLFDDTDWSFSEGLLAVERDGKWGFIDEDYKVIISPQYRWARSFSENLAAVDFSDDKDQWGYIDGAGKTVIPPHFGEAGEFNDGLAPVEADFRYGFINKKGEFVIKATFDFAYSFSEGLAAVELHKKYGYINSSGAFMVPPKYDLTFGFRDGLAPVAYGEWGKPVEGTFIPAFKGQWGFINKHGREVWKTWSEVSLRSDDRRQ